MNVKYYIKQADVDAIILFVMPRVINPSVKCFGYLHFICINKWNINEIHNLMAPSL